MHPFNRLISAIFIITFLLSMGSMQCRTVLAKTQQPPQNRSLKNVNYVNMCIFRKTRLCDFLRFTEYGRSLESRNNRDTDKRGLSRFYSNW